MNPVATADGLSLNLSEDDNAQDLALARDVAKHFRVKAARADEIIRAVTLAVRDWRLVATAAGIPRAEQAQMADAFRVADAL